MKKYISTEIVVIVFIALFALIVLGMFLSETYRDSKAINNGLEECPLNPVTMSFKTIWVKDCDTYIKNFKKAIGEEKK